MISPIYQTKRKKKIVHNLRWILLLIAILVSCGVVCLELFKSSDEKQVTAKDCHIHPSRRIAEDLSILPQKPMVVEKLEKTKEKTFNEKHQEWVETKLKEARDQARAKGLPWADSPRKIISPRPEIKRFNYDAEEHIATLLEVEPGEMLLGEFEFGEDFIKDLKASLSHKIPLNPDEDDYMKQLKKEVQEVKTDLYNRMNAGEDVGEIMRETRKELQEIGFVQMELKAELLNLLDIEEYNEDDLRDFETAANMILSSKGLPPIKMPNYWIRKAQLKATKIKENNK